MTFIAGRYSGALATVDVGITGQGFELQVDTDLEDIGESDAYGLTVIDSVWRGISGVFLQFESLAYKAGSLAAFWPYGGELASAGVLGVLVNPGVAGTKAPIGILASDHARSMVLTATAGTPAASSPATLTASKSLLAKNNNGRLVFNSTLRKVPVRFRLYPSDVGSGVIKHFVTT